MSLLLVASARCHEHSTGPNHPERPARLAAVEAGLVRSDLMGAIKRIEAAPAPIEALLRVHTADQVDLVHDLAEADGGAIDGDTVVSASSFDAARLAAGAGLQSIAELNSEQADAAFCVVRPPGHHATSRQSMGFCLFNNVAVAARSLVDAGERVAIVDIDAHHGNGTQEVFYKDPNVLFISFHQWPCYPGTGRVDERGSGRGVGSTINVPLPAGATGDVYLAAWDRIAAPAVASFGATWVLISAGFDAHRDDPITDMGLSAGDFGVLTARIMQVAPAGRRIFFLEGGYDVEALAASSAALVGAALGLERDSEPLTNGGPGLDAVAVAEDLSRR